MRVKQDKLDRMLVLIYESNNAHDYTNSTRPADWLDSLPMAGLEELDRTFDAMKDAVRREIAKRRADGMPKYSRRYHESLEGGEVGT